MLPNLTDDDVLTLLDETPIGAVEHTLNRMLDENDLRELDRAAAVRMARR